MIDILLNLSVVSLETNNCPEKKVTDIFDLIESKSLQITLNPNHYRLPVHVLEAWKLYFLIISVVLLVSQHVVKKSVIVIYIYIS